MYIGDIYIPYVSEFSANKTTKESKETNFISGDADLDETAPKLKELTIAGVAAAYGNKTSDDYADDLEAVLIRNSAYNIVEYNNKKGYFVLTEVDIPDTVENQNAREFSGTGKFLPAARYECSYRVETDYVESDLAIQFPPIIALPTGATNVRIKSPWEIMFIDEWHGTVGSDGKISIFKPFPIFDSDNYVTASSTGDKTYMESAYGCYVTVLNTQDEKTEWTTVVGTDLPKGRYKVVFRLQDLDVTDDIIVTVTGSVSGELINETFTTGDTYWVTIETSEFEVITHETLTVVIKKATATANTIEVNYGFILPTYTAKVVFENDTEVDCGNVKVFDSNGSTTESAWKQVFNYNHDFSTGIVIQNSFFRWHVDTNEIWNNTGELTNLINNQVGRLYPRAFKNNDVSYIVKEIRPDLVEIEFSLFDGESDAGATDCREIVLARFTPLYVTFELIRNGTFKWDWHVDFSGMANWKATYAPSNTIVTPSVSDLEHTSENGIFTFLFDDCIVGVCKSKNSTALIKSDGGLYTNNTAESGNFMFTLFMITEFTGFEYLIKDASDLTTVGGIEVNRIYDSLTTNTSVEYIYGFGYENTTETINASGLTLANAVDDLVTRVLKNVVLSYGSYSLIVKNNSTSAINRRVGVIIAADLTTAETFYTCCLNVGADDKVSLILIKFYNGVAAAGSYGTDGYGTGGYGGTGEVVILAQSTPVTASPTASYTITCDFDHVEREFTATLKDTSDVIIGSVSSYGDEAFTSGMVGLYVDATTAGSGNINATFKTLDVTDAQIYDGSGYDFAVIGGSAHCPDYTTSDEIILFNGTLGTDIQPGRYNLITKVVCAETTSFDQIRLTFKNVTDNRTLALGTTSMVEFIEGYSTLTSVNKLIEIGDDDLGDEGLISISRYTADKPTMPICVVTYIGLIPVSNIESAEYVSPSNVSFASFNEQNYYRNLESKEFGSNLLNRKYKSYR
ncbi:MAG: hypothetical protein PHT97_13905 [Methanoculleus sp.]|uniref:hypothetical protein n=1 Tax=Methanoculleus sp. TaxID=90427 RepID=UPI00261E6CE3|nr:hypothetical protein [Methanoculleus sp.]MDD4472237.1 hypothetical protein [Methanoculleus sp.]